MSLADQLRAHKESSATRADPDRRRVLEADVESVDATGLAHKALGIGEPAPDFELPIADDETVASAQLLDHGPLVVSFYRGGWCPYCRLELEALEGRRADITAAGGSIVAVSPQTLAATRDTVERTWVSFPVASDLGNRVANAFGLVHKLTPGLVDLYRDELDRDLSRANDQPAGVWELPLPATFVLDSDGVVVYRFVDADYTVRAEPDDVVTAVQPAQE